MSEPTVLEIVIRCQKDPTDREAFDLFYRSLFPYVRLYVRAFRLPTAPLGEEDIIQDIFVKLMERFPEVAFKNEKHFLGYLKSVCEHYVIDVARKYEKQTLAKLSEDLELADKRDSPERAVERSERREALVKLIGSLGPQCQNVLLRFLQGGLSLAEIAREDGLPEGTVYPRFSRCVAELKRRLETSSKLR